VVVDLEAVQVVCVSLEPHQEAAVRHESREPTASRVGGRVISLYPVDSAVHDVFEAVRPGGPCVDGVPVTGVREPVLPQGGGQHQPKLVAQFHGVHPRVDVQDQVHLERLGLAMQPAGTVKLFALGIDVLDIKNIFKQYSGHGVSLLLPLLGFPGFVVVQRVPEVDSAR